MVPVRPFGPLLLDRSKGELWVVWFTLLLFIGLDGLNVEKVVWFTGHVKSVCVPTESKDADPARGGREAATAEANVLAGVKAGVVADTIFLASEKEMLLRVLTSTIFFSFTQAGQLREFDSCFPSQF